MLRLIFAALLLLLLTRLVGFSEAASTRSDALGVAFVGFALAAALFFFGPPGEGSHRRYLP